MAATKKKRIFITLLALLFAGVGVGMLYFVLLPVLRDWHTVQGWVPVEAQVISAELQTSRSSKGPDYRAIGNFRYTWDGRVYTGSRIGLTNGFDNSGDFQQETANTLINAMRSRTPVTVYINPNDPTQSLYDRNLRLDMVALFAMLVVMFGGTGFGLLWGNWHTQQDETGIVDSQAPWLASKEFSSAELHATGKGRAIFTWCNAVFWLAMCVPGNLIISRELAKGNNTVLMILLFDAVGIWLAFSAIRKTFDWKRHGDVSLIMDPHPGRIGGQVGGVITVPPSSTWKQPLAGGHSFLAELICTYIGVRSNQVGIGLRRNRSNDPKRTVWRDFRKVEGESGPTGGMRIKFCFDVPGDLPESSLASMDYPRWQLKISADTKGVALLANGRSPYSQLAVPPSDRDQFGAAVLRASCLDALRPCCGPTAIRHAGTSRR